MDRDRRLALTMVNSTRGIDTPESPPDAGPLIDSYHRVVRNLRVSLTDKCNFRCVYCMPAEGLQWIGKEHLLSVDEIKRLVGIFAALGVTEVRLTGGEPLVRPDVSTIIARIRSISDALTISLTTNGYLLKKYASALSDAGLQRINVSLDTLDHDKFYTLTRRNALTQVLDGLHEIEKYESISPIKVNAVAIRNFSEPEILDFVELARSTSYEVRWIEFMPLDADKSWRKEDVLTSAEIRTIIEGTYRLQHQTGGDPSATAQTFTFADGHPGSIGFISPVSEPFCSACDRVRLTADGMLRTCLFSVNELDLRTPLRAGANDTQLEQLIRAAVWQKQSGHNIGQADFTPASRSMSMIGG